MTLFFMEPYASFKNIFRIDLKSRHMRILPHKPHPRFTPRFFQRFLKPDKRLTVFLEKVFGKDKLDPKGFALLSFEIGRDTAIIREGVLPTEGDGLPSAVGIFDLKRKLEVMGHLPFAKESDRLDLMFAVDLNTSLVS